MAQRIEGFDVLFPAGTPKSAPVTVNTQFANGRVIRIDVQVPDGPAGLTGWAILHSQQQIIPRKPGQFVVANNSDFSWPTEDYPIGSLWAFQGYNTDVYDHTIHVQFLVDELTQLTSVAPPIVPILVG